MRNNRRQQGCHSMPSRHLGKLFLACAAIGASLGVVLANCHAQPQVPIDCARRPVERIPPGTKVGESAPESWSHLIFKTRNKLASGDVDAIPEFARPASEFLFTAMTARVVPHKPDGSGPWRLDKVGMGFGTKIGDSDVVISTETQKKLGADLGVLKLAILGRAEEHLKKIQQVAASPAMMVVDAPTFLLAEGAHRPIVIRYLFLVRPDNGGLATLAWRIDVDAKGNYGPAHGPATLVQPNLVATTALDVDGSKVTLGMPGADAIAVTRLPPGRELPLPQGAADIAGRKELSATEAAELESQFRKAMATP